MAIIINPYRHQSIEKTRDRFLERVSCIESIRTNQHRREEGLSLYIDWLPMFSLYRYLKNAIDQGDFSGLDNYYDEKHFGIEISDKLFTWFNNNELDTILRQVICWLSALYWLKPEKRSIMDKQLYLPILEEVHKVYTSYFEQAKDNSNIFIDEAEQYVRQLYHNSCLDYYGASPPEILNINVFGWDISQDMERAWWFHKKFDIKLNRFYLSNDDWEKIVIKQEHDSLLRAEASDELWLKWKHQFLLFDEHQNHIYSIFDKEKAASGYIYLIKQLGESLYKIGYTKNSDIKKRLSQLQTGNPHDLEIIGYFKCAGKTTEKTLHSLFLAQCKTGEWYSLSQNDVNNILDQNWRRENNIF